MWISPVNITEHARSVSSPEPFTNYNFVWNNLLNELTEEAVLIELSSLFHSNIEETIGLHL